MKETCLLCYVRGQIAGKLGDEEELAMLAYSFVLGYPMTKIMTTTLAFSMFLFSA